MSETGITLINAYAAAKQLQKAMSPFCTRCEIAGSIRRRKPEVKDIEIVCVPRWTQEGDLFGEKQFLVNTLFANWASKQTTVRWIKPGVPDVQPWHVAPEGKYWRGYIESLQVFGSAFPDSPCKVDIFIATLDNFGLQFLIRTGSADFSKEIVTEALRQGLKVEDGKLWNRDKRVITNNMGRRATVTVPREEIPTPDEADVFHALNLFEVEPCDRRSGDDVKRRWKGGKTC